MGERFLGALLPSILSGLIGQMCFMTPDKYKGGWISSFMLLRREILRSKTRGVFHRAKHLQVVLDGV